MLKTMYRAQLKYSFLHLMASLGPGLQLELLISRHLFIMTKAQLAFEIRHLKLAPPTRLESEPQFPHTWSPDGVTLKKTFLSSDFDYHLTPK